MSNKFSRDRFVEFLIESEVLLFGDYELNSGRKSPYFFNLGNINSGEALRSLGEAYARTIVESDIKVDVLFGPAYKGIPIAVSTSMALGMMGSDVSFAFNRKEAKNHGEGGNIVGADIRRKVLILDETLSGVSGEALKGNIGILNQLLNKQSIIILVSHRDTEENQLNELKIPYQLVKVNENPGNRYSVAASYFQ